MPKLLEDATATELADALLAKLKEPGGAYTITYPRLRDLVRETLKAIAARLPKID